jgi:AcrR family transcriptional regulator
VGNREALLEAAIECLSERGYARTTARDLVAASGTNLGAIGYHFGSKERLLNEAVHESFRRWLQPLIDIAAAPGPATPFERLRDGFGALLGSLEEQRPVIVSLFEALAQVERSEELRRGLATSYEEFRVAIAELIGSTLGMDEREAAEARTLASALIALFDGLLVQWLLDPRHTPDTTDIAAAAQALLVRVQLVVQGGAVTP